MNAMIALVSEQRMQNVIPIFQAGARYEQFWLVRSTDADQPGSRFAKAWKDTSGTLGSEVNVHSAEPSVGAYGIAETRGIVLTLIREVASSEVVVNFTGGTKCMSIGAYLAAQSTNVMALYVDTANEKLVWFHPDGRIEEVDFDLAGRLTVSVYLKANGKQTDDERTRQHGLPESAFAAARALVTLWPQCAETLELFGSTISQSRDSVAHSAVDGGVANVLAQYSLIQSAKDVWQIDRTGRAFLTGKWLDAMVYVLFESSGLFDDVKPELRLQGVENELDVLATRKGQLAIVECKSGDLGGQTTLNKLQAIRTGFGTFARPFFVTSRKAKQVDKAFRERAKEYGVREIITAETLTQLATIVKERMRGTP
jgi:hypothetical protein